MSNHKEVVLLAGSRTPIGSFGRSLKNVPVDKLAEHVIRHAVRRAGVNPGAVDGFILGHAFQNGFTPNTARCAWLNAGFPASAVCDTVQIQCGSGMKAINDAMDQIRLGHGNLYVAGGAESMSNIAYLVDGALRNGGRRAKPHTKFYGEFQRGFMPKFFDFVARRFANGFVSGLFNSWMANMFKYGPRPYIGLVEDGMLPTQLLWDMCTTHMAGTAENVADTLNISREEQDAYALRSQELATAAIASGRFALEIDPIETGRGVFSQDEHPRETSLEKLAKLRGVNRTRNITAGNSSGINDGACAVVVASKEYADANGLPYLSKLVDHCRVAVEPTRMGLGPVSAIQTVLKRNGLTLKNIGLVEINEAFAAQYLGCEKLLGLDRSIVNVNGGAIALGHPIAMSGARVPLTISHEMNLRHDVEFALGAACIGGGMGIVTLFKHPKAC